MDGEDGEAELWALYWASLSPDERQSELRAMTEYVDEADY